MRTKTTAMALIAAAWLVVLGGITLAQQDRYTLKVSDGLAFSEFEGYDTWADVAVGETEASVKAILGNPTMIAHTKKASRTMASFSRKASRL
jgi:hypothetical protein